MKKLGRTFNHLEDLVIFYGSAGIQEVIQHLTEIYNDTSSIRMKWDGCLQIYWGREYKDGPLIMTGHNGWARGFKTTTPDELYDFIINQSGKDRTNVSEQRKSYAKKFGDLFPLFDAATPKDFVGFVYADLLYWNRPPLVNDEYNFYPNHTGYTVHKDTELGNKIKNSQILLAGHAYFDTFGVDDDQQIPLDNFDIFNNTDSVVIIDPYYSKVKIFKNEQPTKYDYLDEISESIDIILSPIPGVSAFKQYIYQYMNYTSATSNPSMDFFYWMQHISSISKKQQDKIAIHLKTILDGNGWTYGQIFFSLLSHIQSIKNRIISELEQHDCDVKAYNPEGWVKYADDSKQFGHIKLVPRHKWKP